MLIIRITGPATGFHRRVDSFSDLVLSWGKSRINSARDRGCRGSYAVRVGNMSKEVLERAFCEIIYGMY